MDPIYKSLQEHIKGGQYFIDARNWYRHKYIHPFSQRSFVSILSFIICALFIGILININGLFPSVVQIKYLISSENTATTSARVMRADQIQNDPLASITDIMTRNYVTKREQYNYNNLKKQFIFIKSNSTRIAFRKFYQFMSLDNPSSPVMTYQRDIKRGISIISAEYKDVGKAVVKFNSIAKDVSGKVIESKIWTALINYDIDQISTELKPGSRFNFSVTDYQLKLIKDKLSN